MKGEYKKCITKQQEQREKAENENGQYILILITNSPSLLDPQTK